MRTLSAAQLNPINFSESKSTGFGGVIFGLTLPKFNLINCHWNCHRTTEYDTVQDKNQRICVIQKRRVSVLMKTKSCHQNRDTE